MMINKIKSKLVIGYTFAIIGIMLCTSIAGYVALEHITVQTNKRSLLTYLDTETYEAIEMFKSWRKDPNIKPDVVFFTAHKMAFNNIVYWVTPDNKILMAEELNNNISLSIREVVKSWDYPSLKIKTLYLNAPGTNNTWHFLMVSQDVYDKGVYLGRVFVGTNLSPLDKISNRYSVIAITIIVFVSILAFFVGNFFASKAIKPIKITLQKQKEFIGDASHEMRTPLSVLLSSIDIIKGTPKDKKILEIMKSEILNMSELVKNLLILARVEDAEKKNGFTTFNLSHLAKNVTNSMTIMPNNKNVVINLQADDEIKIFANESNIRNLFTIFIDNAIKYGSADTRIDIALKKVNNSAIISIKDNGIGIKEADLDKVFERFYRVDKSRSREQGSFGLGLSLAKKIIELHKGKIEVKSKLKEGSTFTIILPL